MNISYRKVKEGDRELYLTFMNEFYHSDAVLHPTDKALHVNTWNELMRSEEYLICYLFELEGEVVGYGLLSKSFSPEVGGTIIWVEEIYIREQFRNKGIGSEFLRIIEKEHPCSRLRLEVEPDNKKATLLYKRHGYDVLPYMQMVKDFA